MFNESLDRFAKSKLKSLSTRGLYRSVVDTYRADAVHIQRDGRDLISFCCNDYLGLTHHPEVKAAAAEAIALYGVGAGASRLITGNNPLYAELEKRLAELKGTEDSCVFGSGYMANSGILPALAGPEDLIVIDNLGHASMYMGARASRAKILTFRHNDTDDLAEILSRERNLVGRCIVMTEGVFSMDGDRAPLDTLADLCTNQEAWLMVDDAHGFGVLGEGRGSAFEYHPHPDVPLQMGTLSKAVGGYGAFLCASTSVIDFMKNRARSLIYTTGLPPSVIAAAIAGIKIIQRDTERVARPLKLAQLFCSRLGLASPQSAIVPVVIGEEDAALVASKILEERGFLVTPIRPPTVPAGTSRLRFTFTAEHTEAQVAALVGAVIPLIEDLESMSKITNG